MAAATAVLGFASAACAQESSTLEISAQVPSFCLMTTAQGSVDIGSLTDQRNVQVTIPFVLKCSAGTTYEAWATGLYDDRTGPYTGDHYLADGAKGVKYTVWWDIIGTGGLQLAHEPCQLLCAPPTADGTAESHRLIISVNKSDTPRIPGNYSDLLTLWITY